MDRDRRRRLPFVSSSITEPASAPRTARRSTPTESARGPALRRIAAWKRSRCAARTSLPSLPRWPPCEQDDLPSVPQHAAASRAASTSKPAVIYSSPTCARALASAAAVRARASGRRLDRGGQGARASAGWPARAPARRDPHGALDQAGVVLHQLAAPVVDIILHAHAHIQAHAQRHGGDRQLGAAHRADVRESSSAPAARSACQHVHQIARRATQPTLGRRMQHAVEDTGGSSRPAAIRCSASSIIASL